MGLGFFKYNGMPLEEFLMAFLISEVLTPRELKFESDNIYYEAIRPSLENKEREELKNKWLNHYLIFKNKIRKIL